MILLTSSNASLAAERREVDSPTSSIARYRPPVSLSSSYMAGSGDIHVLDDLTLCHMSLPLFNTSNRH